MNNDTRKRIAEIQSQLTKFREKVEATTSQAADLRTSLEDLKTQVEEIREEEQGKLDGMPESLQGSEKGQAMESAISELDAAIDSITNLDDALSLEVDPAEFDNAIESLGNASA